METFLLKFTFGTIFVGILVIFLTKIILLLGLAAKLKAAAFLADHTWIKSAFEALKAVPK